MRRGYKEGAGLRPGGRENNGAPQQVGLGVHAQRASKKLPRAGGNQIKGQECSQGFWASSLYCAKGMGLPREGERRQREQRLLEPEIWAGRERNSWAGRVGSTGLSSRSSRWKIPVTPCQAGPASTRPGPRPLDPLEQLRGCVRSKLYFKQLFLNLRPIDLCD